MITTNYKKSRFFNVYIVLVIAIFISCFLGVTVAKSHSYKFQEQIPVIVDKVVPAANPSETYSYFRLPFCGHDKKIDKEGQGIGETIAGTRRIVTPYEIEFKASVQNKKVCDESLEKKEIKKFIQAIKSQDVVHMEIDGLPVKHEIGTVKGDNVFIYAHLHFLLKYNKDRIVEADVRPDASKVILLSESQSEQQVLFTYSVSWEESNKPFSQRMDRYSAMAMLFPEELEIQWFSIVNSGVLVLLLTAFLGFILMRILKRDYQQYTALDDEDEEDETGWKLISGDVFRFPAHKNLLSAFLGTGIQLLLLASLLLTLSAIKLFYPHTRGQMYSAIIAVHALTAGVAGYVSGAFYKMMGCTRWVNNVLLTVCVFAVPVFLVFSFLNTVAIVYRSSAALPFTTILLILTIYFLVTFPLSLLGAIAGKNRPATFNEPCRTKKVPREIPPAPWYRGALSHLLIAGFLPFSAIYVELYYVFRSFWGDKMYTPVGLLLLVFIILLLVTGCITITLTYLQLSMENYKWWWRSFFSGGATSVFILAYSVFYLWAESSMDGFFQLSFYFGYMVAICYFFFLMLGSVGFFSSLIFVKRIYKAIKAD
eukprot:gb/GECH01012177.1/.p1 GENE.gb/GECH01012177.1/~~gb/GECH01012177.1/.p1  ORF type:complete len:594 (+),score=103.58 gb/GECH01012177.1/:1-1782(+)